MFYDDKQSINPCQELILSIVIQLQRWPIGLIPA